MEARFLAVVFCHVSRWGGCELDIHAGESTGGMGNSRVAEDGEVFLFVFIYAPLVRGTVRRGTEALSPQTTAIFGGEED